MKNFILYQGPSVLDGKPIVCIATLNSNNVKTGNMVQTWIIRSDMSPIDAKNAKADTSICGNCPLKQNVGGGCYVNIGQAPNQVYKAFKRGNYATLNNDEIAETLSGKAIRLGAYGDPAAVPVSVWKNALKNVRKHTGYTHQISHKNFDKRISDFCITSAETASQAKRYHDKGLRTFRVVGDYSDLFVNEIECPSESGVTCVECGACNGSTNDGKNIAIVAHGTRGKKHAEKYKNANLIAVSG